MKKKIFSLVVLLFVSLFLTHGLSLADELKSVQMAIQAQGAGWLAGETSVSHLAPAEQQRLLGLINPAPGEHVTYAAFYEPLSVALPASIDWRNNNGNFVTSVRNQGGCGSCWAFASTAALESATLISRNTPNVDLDLSEQVVVSCSGAGSCGGGSIVSASDFFKSAGLR